MGCTYQSTKVKESVASSKDQREYVINSLIVYLVIMHGCVTHAVIGMLMHTPWSSHGLQTCQKQLIQFPPEMDEN